MATRPRFYEDRALRSRGFPRDVFELVVDRVYDQDRYRIHFGSRICQIEEAIYLCRSWVRGEESVYALADYIERLVGRTLMALVESCGDPVEPARLGLEWGDEFWSAHRVPFLRFGFGRFEWKART